MKLSQIIKNKQSIGVIALYIVFGFVLFLNCNCLNIDVFYNLFSRFNYYNNKALITVIVLAFFVIYFVLNKGTVLKTFKRFKNSVILLLFFSLVVLYIQIIRGENFFDIVGESYFYLISLLFFPLADLINDRKKLNILSLIVIITCLIFVALNTYYVLSKNIPECINVAERNGRIKFSQTADFVGLGFLVAAVNIKNKNIFVMILSILLVIVSPVYLYLVADVRMYFVAAIGTCFIAFLFLIIPNKSLRFLVFSIILIVFAVTSIFLIQRLLGTGSSYNSAIVRFDEISFFSQHFFDNAIFGFGFNGDKIRGVYNTTDIGILGFIFRFGLLGIIWAHFFIHNFVRTGMENEGFIHKNIGKIVVISGYALLSSITLSCFDAQRILIFPISLFLLNYYLNEKEAKINDSVCYTTL